MGRDVEIVHVVQALDAGGSENVNAGRYPVTEDYYILRRAAMP